jgi:hypothetical protein
MKRHDLVVINKYLSTKSSIYIKIMHTIRGSSHGSWIQVCCNTCQKEYYEQCAIRIISAA